jgi:O-antigen/teichoic acid export membrane protein
MYAIYPILTRLESESGQAARAGDLVLRLVLWTTIPIAIILGWLASPVVHTIYGPNWSEVIPLMKWTLCLAVVTALTQVVYMLVLARNRSRLCLSCDVAVLLGTAVSLGLALGHGVSWYLRCLIVVQLAVGVSLVQALLNERALTRGGLLKAVAPACIGTIFGVCIASSTLWILHLTAATFLPAVLWGICFGVTYIACLRLVFTSTLVELVSYLPGRSSVSRFLRLAI